MRYELWDAETNNIIGAYATDTKALAIVHEAIDARGHTSIEAWTLGRMGDNAREESIVEGSALADRALESSIQARSAAQNTVAANGADQNRH